ncbi:pyruvate formate lyase family protein [Chloroflexota bacterium]
MTTTTAKMPVKGEPTERVKILRETLFQTETRISVERLRFLKEAYEETDGEPAVIRVAKTYEKHLAGMTLFMHENPIVGNQGEYRTSLVPFPEISCDWMIKEFEFYTYGGKTKKTKEDKSEEDRKLLEESVNYWEKRCKWHKAREMFSQKNGVDYKDLYEAGFFSAQGFTPYGRINPDYGKVLNMGLEGVIAEVEEEIRKLPFGPLESYQKRKFYDALIIACNAVINW